MHPDCDIVSLAFHDVIHGGKWISGVWESLYYFLQMAANPREEKETDTELNHVVFAQYFSHHSLEILAIDQSPVWFSLWKSHLSPSRAMPQTPQAQENQDNNEKKKKK